MRYSILAFVLLCSCSDEKTVDYIAEDDVREIEFEYLFEDQKIFSQVKEVQVFQLETTKEGLMSSIERCLVYDNNIFTLSMLTGKIATFNLADGQFLGNVGSQGKGPAEFLEGRDISIDREEKELYILDYRRIHVFDIMTLNYKKSIGVDFENSVIYNPMEFCSMGEGVFVFWCTSPDAWDKNIEFYNFVKFKRGRYKYYYPFRGTKDVLSIRFTNSGLGKALIRPPLGDFGILEWNEDVLRYKYKLKVSSPVPLDKVSVNLPGRTSELNIGRYETRISKVFEVKNSLYLEIEGKEQRKYQAIVDLTGDTFASFALRHVDFPHIVYSDGEYLYGYMLPDRVLNRYRKRSELKDYNGFFYSQLDMTNVNELANPIMFKITL